MSQLNIGQVVSQTRSAFQSGVTRPLAWRKAQLEAMIRMLEEHHDWNIYDIAARLPENHRVHPCTVYRIWRRQQSAKVARRLPRPVPQRYVKIGRAHV